jgi:hypothetical protein
MSVTVTTASEHRQLTTVSAVVGRLSLSSVPEGFDQLVTAVSRAIERYCGRIFAQQTYREIVNGTDSDMLLLSHAPIIGTPTITSDSSPVVDFEVRDSEAGMLYREVGWARAAWIGWGIETDRIPSNYPNFTIDYTAGYKLPGEADTTLPPDIEEAAIMTAMQWYRRETRDGDITSKKVGDLYITYAGVSDKDRDGIPAMARALLPRRVV